MNEIETTIGELLGFYGVSLEEAGFDAENADVFVRIWKGEEGTVHEGWHASAPYSDIILMDEDMAPKDDEQAEEIRMGVKK